MHFRPSKVVAGLTRSYRRPPYRRARLGLVPPPVHPAVQRVVDAAARNGVAIEVHVFDTSTHTAEDAARSLGAELGQIVKSLVFVAPADGGGLEPIVCLVSGPEPRRPGAPRRRHRRGRRAARDGARGDGADGLHDRRASRRSATRDRYGWSWTPTSAGIPEVWAAAGTDGAVFPVSPAALRTLANAVVAPIAEERTATGALNG